MRRLCHGLALFAFVLCTIVISSGASAASCEPFHKLLTGTAHRLYGMDAPVAMFAGQMTQESGCRPGITAWDNGRGLAQFMDGTSAQVARLYPELGPPEPYSPAWAIPALLRYDGWLYARVKGADACEKWGAALTSYNGGLGYVMQAQKASADPAHWFGVTEKVPTRQNAKNWDYSRRYPRWIIFTHAPKYTSWGATVCEGKS